MDGLHPDSGRKYFLGTIEKTSDNLEKEEDKGQIGVEVKIFAPMSHNVLTSVVEHVK
jgi:hypothetical protein